MSNMVPIFQGIFGIVIFCFIAWLMSENRRKINFRWVSSVILLQFVVAGAIIKIQFIRSCFLYISSGIELVRNATMEGASFVFGYLAGKDISFVLKNEGSSIFIFAFQVLPMIIVVSSLTSLLFHWRILPFVINAFSNFFQKSTGIGGALGICMGGKIFFGETEVPLLVKPYLKNFSRSELFSLMTAGMATTSVCMMLVYSAVLKNTILNPTSHIITASVISIFSALVLSRLVIPQTEEKTEGEIIIPYNFVNFMEAIFQGTKDGIHLTVNIAGIIITAIALVSLVNSFLGILFPPVNGQFINLSFFLSYLFIPIAWLMGIPMAEASTAGGLLGIKTVLNELIAFSGLAKSNPQLLSPVSKLIMIYALCGFANFGSTAIQVSCLSTMIPERRAEIASLGFKSLIIGTFASCMSGAIVGIIHRIL